MGVFRGVKTWLKPRAEARCPFGTEAAGLSLPVPSGQKLRRRVLSRPLRQKLRPESDAALYEIAH
jgi:hypothetical protein